jgi:uncharacterized protein (DUF2336 family)
MVVDSAFIAEVEGAIAGASSERRREMLRKVTDLFVSDRDEFTSEELAIFDNVIVRLAAEIEQAARELLARRLAPIRNAPPDTIRLLAFDDAIEVADPVLGQASLDDKTLIEIARTKGQRHMLSISRRASLSEAVTDVLVALGDREVVLDTVDNYGASFSDNGFSVLVRRSEGDDTLAEFVGSRPEIPAHLLTALVAKASETVRIKLEAAHPRARMEVRRAVAEASSRVEGELSASADYAAALALVEDLQRSGRLNEHALAAFAKNGAYLETAAALATMCSLPLQFVELCMVRDRSETLLVLAKSLDVSRSTVNDMLLLQSKKGLISRGAIAQRLARFERLQRATAQEIVRVFRARAHAQTSTPNDGAPSSEGVTETQPHSTFWIL